jgi:hypothetical protein
MEDLLKSVPPSSKTTLVFLHQIMLFGRKVCSLEECPIARIIKKWYSSPKMKKLICLRQLSIASLISRLCMEITQIIPISTTSRIMPK